MIRVAVAAKDARRVVEAAVPDAPQEPDCCVVAGFPVRPEDDCLVVTTAVPAVHPEDARVVPAASAGFPPDETAAQVGSADSPGDDCCPVACPDTDGAAVPADSRTAGAERCDRYLAHCGCPEDQDDYPGAHYDCLEAYCDCPKEQDDCQDRQDEERSRSACHPEHCCSGRHYLEHRDEGSSLPGCYCYPAVLVDCRDHYLAGPDVVLRRDYPDHWAVLVDYFPRRLAGLDDYQDCSAALDDLPARLADPGARPVRED